MKVDGEDVLKYSFTRADKVPTMSMPGEHKISVNDQRSIDPALLFQRMILIVNTSADVSLEEVTSYELCPYPTSLFASCNIFRDPGKAPLS